MSNETIVLCFPVADHQIAQIIKCAAGRRVIVSNQDDIAKDIDQADIFCGHAKKDPIDWERVTRRGRLRWIQSSAAGLDHCLSPEVVDSEILVSGCSGLFANQVAEQTLALVFALVRNMPTFFRAQQNREYLRLPTDEIQGKTIGIVGYGGNGQRIAQVFRPLVERIIATDCFPDVAPGFADEVLPADCLNKMFSRSNIVIVTLPGTSGNLKLIGREQLTAMQRGSYLINVGRGSVVDHVALLEALDVGQLAAAGLDVCEPEPPPPNSPLWDAENILLTPHVGAQSATRVPVTVELFCENLRRYDAGERLLNRVDKKLGFPRPGDRVSSGDDIFGRAITNQPTR